MTHAPSAREALSEKIQLVFEQRYQSKAEAVDALKDLQANILKELRANDQGEQAEIVEDTISRLAEKAFPGIKLAAKRPLGVEEEVPPEKRRRVEKTFGQEPSGVVAMDEEAPLRRGRSAKRKPPKTRSSFEPSATLKKTLVNRLIEQLPTEVQENIKKAAGKHKNVREYIFLVGEGIAKLPTNIIAQIIKDLPPVDQKAVLAMMPSREEEVQEKKALEFFDAISKDREFTALYNSILGKPCPTTKDLKNLEGDPRASKRIISYANFVQIGLKTEWKNLPPEMKEGYPDIDENRPFDTLEIGKKVLQAVHTANLFILVLRVGMAAPDAWGERVDLPPFEDSVKWLEKLLEIAAQLLPTLKLPPELVLDCDGMTHLPTEIKDLKGVSHLTIKRASFPTLPDQIGELKTLTELDLSDNKFTSLPSTIGQLEALETLNSSGNQLTTVPSTIGQLKALKQVDLSNNKIDRLPSTFWQLKALETLYLNNNQLTTLPQECRGLNALSELSLLHNPLTSLPQEALQELTPHLKILSVDGDKMMLIPAAHDDAVRNASIFDYLRGRLHEVVQPLRDMLGV